MSFCLNSLKGGYIGESKGGYYRGYYGGCLDSSLHGLYEFLFVGTDFLEQRGTLIFKVTTITTLAGVPALGLCF